MAKKQRADEEETSYWLSYSDMMAALLLMFVLIIACTMLKTKKQCEEAEKLQQDAEIARIDAENLQKELNDKETQLKNLVGVRPELIQALIDEFAGSDLNIHIDSQTGSITFDSSILFDVDQYELKESGKDFLEQFLPRYLGVLLDEKYVDSIGEIIIEGHTDTNGTYLYNLELSQNRALSVASFCLKEDNSVLSQEMTETLRRIVTANGKSFSDPIYASSGIVDMVASRRVEFKFRLTDEEMVQQLFHIMESMDDSSPREE